MAKAPTACSNSRSAGNFKAGSFKAANFKAANFSAASFSARNPRATRTPTPAQRITHTRIPQPNLLALFAAR